MSDALLFWFIEKSLGIGLLIAIILLLRPVVMKFLNPSVQYMLWLSLPVYLLTPMFYLTSSTHYSITFFASTLHPFKAGYTTDTNSELITAVLMLWLSGIIIFTIKFILQIRLLSQFNSVETFLLAKKISETIVVKRVPINSPAIYGIFNPTLLLPIDFPKSLSNQQINLILEHKKNHWVKKDPLWNLIAWWVCKIFWFHPVVAVAYHFFQKDQELSCDFEVTKTLSNSEKSNYGQLLLNQSHAPDNSILCHWSGASLVKERMKMLKNHTENRKSKWIGFILVGLISTTAVILNAKEIQKIEATPIKVVAPMYPRSAAMEGVEGFVTLEFDLDGGGYPKNIEIIQSSPMGVFDNNSKEAIVQWQFKEINKTSFRYTMEYKLEE